MATFERIVADKLWGDPVPSPSVLPFRRLWLSKPCGALQALVKQEMRLSRTGCFGACPGATAVVQSAQAIIAGVGEEFMRG
jgi:hypothetical protein